MKKLKKMVAVLLTVVMAMAMGVTVFAQGETGTITVNVKDGQTLAGQTVNVYKLFEVTKSGENHYGYKVNEKYKTILKSVFGDNLADETDQGYYDAVVKATDTDNGTNTQKFADDFTKKLLEYNKNPNNADSKILADKSQKFGDNATDTKWDVTDLSYGYYLVCQTGTKAIQSSLVELSGDTATVNLKSEAPSIDKTVDNKKLESVQIGDTITYTIKGTIPDPTGYTNYVYKIHDELSAGLDFVGNTASVKIGNAEAEDVTFSKDAVNARKMTLDLSKYVTTDNVGTTVTVTYKAKVNSEANVGTVNNAQLEYSNNPSDENSHTTTPPSKVETPTYPLDIKKTDTNDETQLLAGAKFKLYTEKVDADNNSGNNTIKVVTGEAGKYTVADNQTTGTDEIISIAKSLSENEGYNLQLNGLKAGTYYLVETEAPDGYNKLSAPIEVTIKNTADPTNVNNWTLNGSTDNKVLTVKNSTGSLLPSTGGTGTIIFSIVAGVLILGVAASFIKDRKKEA